MWSISENAFIKENIPHCGNKYLIGNGYFGIRGTMEEYEKNEMCATNMAGIYDRVGSSWRESVNAPNLLYTYITVNGKKLALPADEPLAHRQELDFYNAIHKRETVWEACGGKITVACERFASMSNQHLIGLKYSVFADFDCSIEIITGIDGDVWDINGPHFKTIIPDCNDGVLSVTGITGEKEISVKSECVISADFEHSEDIICTDFKALKKISFNAKAGSKYTIEKIGSVATSVDSIKYTDNITSITYASLKELHIKAWKKIWDISYIQIDGDSNAELALNYSLYHMNCIAPRNFESCSIPARGLSGQVYKGAVFWDTEMFMIDYYIHTEPAIAKTLLKYRIDTLSGARTKAAEYNLDGAYYAWESQEGGFEACSDYNVVDVFTKRPMRTYFRDKQYHVSAAVVYAFMKYINATGDYSVLTDGGLEVIIECARMYRSLLLTKADKTLYEIHDVVGPDEYHERVNNNAYTNRMAKFVFKTAADMIELAKESYPTIYSDLDNKFNLKKLYEDFGDSYKNMYIPEPNSDGLIEQFDGYFKLEDTSVEEVRSRLLDPKEYWGGAYGVASDTQVLKQADVVAMLSMFKDDHSVEIMQKNLDYYEPRTEHGSSLSACMYSLLFCYTGNPDSAYPLFLKSASADLNTGGKEWAGLIYIGGTHPASEGGAWIVAVKGFAGISVQNGEIVCNPKLPANWKSMSFHYRYNGKLYKVEITQDKSNITQL